MSAEVQAKPDTAMKKAWCNTATFATNLGRRALILGRYSLACWQQYKINQALRHLGGRAFQALEESDTASINNPAVREAVEKARELKERKDKNYQTIAAIREQIAGSCVVPTPEEPGGIEENPPVP